VLLDLESGWTLNCPWIVLDTDSAMALRAPTLATVRAVDHQVVDIIGNSARLPGTVTLFALDRAANNVDLAYHPMKFSLDLRQLFLRIQSALKLPQTRHLLSA